MTQPPTPSDSPGQEPPAGSEPAADALVDELRGRLPGLVDEVLASADVVGELDRDVQAADRARVNDEVRKRALADADDILRITNPEISALRLANRLLAAHLRPEPEVTGRNPNPRDNAGHAAFGFALWLGMIYPLLFWQIGQTTPTGIVRFGVFAGLVVAAGFSLRWAYVAVAWAGNRFSGKRAFGGAGWPLMTALATTYLLLLWRVGPSSVTAMGSFWASVVWIACGLVTLVLLFLLVAVTNVPTANEEEGRRVPRQVYARGFLFGFAAVTMTYLLLSATTSWPQWAGWVSGDAMSFLILVVIGPITLRAQVVPASLSQDPNRRGSAVWNQRLTELHRNVLAAEEDWHTAARTTVRATVSRHLHETVNPAFSTVLTGLDRSGLGLMRAGDRVVTTAAFARLRSLTDGITGGAVGVAGPRGAGKSTMLDAYQAGKFLGPGKQHIALLESVPVRYDAREFVLHLFARTCTEVIRFCGERVDDQPSRWPAWLAHGRKAGPFLVAAALWVVVGFAGSATITNPRPDFRAWLVTMWWPIVFVLGSASLVYLFLRRKPPAAPPPPSTRARPGDLRALGDLAAETLNGIEFQQKHTSGWSGKVGLLFGAETGLTDSRELTRQPRSYPRIVHDFSEFLRTTITCLSAVPSIATPSVVIILDELDKILSPAEAQDFVNEVKALFNLDVPGFLFLVSVSEDALASFERRGLPVRDAFDSAFDAIFRLEYLTLDDARSVLSSRVLGLPEPFMCLCHCMSGGLPRELLRVARQVTAQDGTLEEVSRQLVADDLAGKAAGLRTIVAREAYDDVLAGEFVRHVDAHLVTEPAVLLGAAAKPPIPLEADSTALLRIQMETLAYLYYLGTVREVFGTGFSKEDLARGRDSEGDASFDTLASVRQLFSVNARLAWLTISAFRESWNLPTVPAPAGTRPLSGGNGERDVVPAAAE
ncbi:transcriptional regulator [Amycolatopsis pigmentata]|uniref:Transcriptional regulator n=1 Tax=Amycolatopsis pigmentata TaxID=450801 RepID=A0ABW5FNT7_9PSEU